MEFKSFFCRDRRLMAHESQSGWTFLPKMSLGIEKSHTNQIYQNSFNYISRFTSPDTPYHPIVQFKMQFNYQAYVTRYKYDPYCWPPDLGLAQLHARCSEPGLINALGVRCPCCGRRSKKIMEKWWKRNIAKDLKQYGAAIPGYFQLMAFYGCFIGIVMLLNSIYPIYITYYACNNFDPNDQSCLSVGFLQYVSFRQLIKLLDKNNENSAITILIVLQTVVFYVLLAANFFSIFYITILNQSAKQEIKQNKSHQVSRFLMFHNIPEPTLNALAQPSNGKQSDNDILKVIKVHEIKKYVQLFKKRNQLYYKILSLYAVPQDPFEAKKLNQQLQQFHQLMLEEKKKLNQYSGKAVIMLSDIQAKESLHRIYQVKDIKRWEYGFRTILKDFNFMDFNQEHVQMCTVQFLEGSDLKWENLGESLGRRTASRIKTVFVALLFIGISYAFLYYPLLFSMKTHVKTETLIFVRLTTFEKILPNLISIIMVALAIYFKKYMEKLAEERNPRDQLQKSSFILLSTVSFHILFFVILPTFFFMVPNGISETVKLYCISGQARTFLIIQLIIVLVDMPYRLWKDKKVQNLSDQRFAFRYNQRLLHESVESRDYPLEARVMVLFRVWSLALFYSFFTSYVLFYVVIVFTIIFWRQKHNLYKHYSVRRKISIKLFSKVLVYFVNFFSIFLCFIYCSNVYQYPIYIAMAILVTATSVIGNIVYWVILNRIQNDQLKREKDRSSSGKSEGQEDIRRSLLMQEASLKQLDIWQSGQNFEIKYKEYLESIVNDSLDEQISQHLEKLKEKGMEDKKSLKKSVEIEMVDHGNVDVEVGYESEGVEDQYEENQNYLEKLRQQSDF